ncbi:hypothetical protein C8J56DRAFT_734783, partial [Mycena floridula]
RLIDQVLDMIHRLPWSGSIHGFPLKVDITYLAEFLMTDWLSSEHVDLMMDLLRREIFTAGQASEVEVASEAAMFMSKVKSAYESQDSYCDSQKVGTALGNRERKKLAIEVNVRDSHWVAIIIDCEKRVIWHGDSFHAAADPELRVPLKWWIHFHTGNEYRFHDMPITTQHDGHSCGLLAWLAMRLFLLKQGKPIIELLLGHVTDERLKVFVKILERHEDQV